MSSLEELRALTTTWYIPPHDTLETVRAGSSMPNPHVAEHAELIEDNGRDDVILEEHPSRLAVDETPKLIIKRARMSAPPARDEAVKVLRKLQMSPAEELRPERFDYYQQRWFHTTRNSELELIEHVLLHPNHRPYYFAMQSRYLEAEDLSNLIQTSLLATPKETGQCLARFAIKPVVEMPFQVLFGILKSLEESSGIQLSDCVVTATLIEQDGSRKITSRFRTTNCMEYGELEPELDEQGKLMASKATITCSVPGQRHVQTQITYWNNAAGRVESTSRSRYIELEQTVKCLSRPRVLIAEEQNTLIEFEIEDEMVPLSMGVPPVEDLIDVLRELHHM